MPKTHDYDQPSTTPSDDADVPREDWDPMMPETTVPDPAVDQAVSDEDWQKWKDLQEEEQPG